MSEAELQTRADLLPAAADGNPPGRRMLDLPQAERPREIYLARGPAGCTDEQLLSILLRTGSRGRNVAQLAHDILEEFGGLWNLADATDDELQQFAGIGRVKAIELGAVLEMVRRITREKEGLLPQITSAADVYRLMLPRLRHEQRELMIVLLLDVRNRVRREYLVSIGTQTESLVHPREVFYPAVRGRASQILVVHNHPSGDPSPSPADIACTRRLQQAGELLGIQLIDHVIVAESGYTSLKEQGHC